MKLEERREGLLALVEGYRERECRRILQEARSQARERLRQVYRRERAHLHRQVVAERGRAWTRLQVAFAEEATRERRASERASEELLAAAWPRLRERLVECWRDPARRQRWASHYLRQGLTRLPRGLWTVRHAAGWAEDERRDLAAELTAVLGQEPRFRTDAAIAAGLIVEGSGAVLDASLEGLLRDRPRLEGRLLALSEVEGAP